MARVKKAVVDLDNPIWLSPAGFGRTCDSNNHFCSLGKLGVCVLNQHSQGYELYRQLSGKQAARIYGINDKKAYVSPNGSITSPMLVLVKDGGEKYHWEAIAQMLKDLKAAGKVRFIGNKLLKKLKQELAGNVK